MAADHAGAVHLGQAPGEVGVVRIDSPPVPLGDGHPVAVKIEAGRAAGPDLVRRDRIGGVDIVGDVEHRSAAWQQSLQFEHPAVRQFTPHRYPELAGIGLHLLAVE
jgi:hypothetical protein